uniref:NADH-ubiquinone oxidoreductase chain 6 n=1 Tax=Pseudoxenodon stejnegeri TaxID=1938231 RepID=A0A7S6XYW9_9SAUR|nr:NADH dehydrogenase subunit 6 [Pseudoxenodon stejnegeri]QOW83899.1 NADH dehydrogenase subunit 6 [Pseudoxenodon stejnegeri]
MNYAIGFILMFVVFSVVVVGVTSVPYRGVIALMGVSFFCCIFLVMLGRTFSALVMYIVYLGGLIVVFSYCVSVEKDEVDVCTTHEFKNYVIFVLGILIFLWWVVAGELSGLLIYMDWEEVVCLEANGGGVFYFGGGMGLMMCSWGLLVVLFSILVILGWSRLGGLRPF